KRMIDRIKVTPRRKNEPLFEGYLLSVDGEWRIHSLDLTTSSTYGLELLDTMHITQIHAPVSKDVWRVQNQIAYLSFNKFGFDISGNFLNVYSNYDLNPVFGKKYFNRILMSYDSNSIKKDSSYWSSVRPIALEADERRDFVFKDSMHHALSDSFSTSNLDSLKKQQKPIGLQDIFIQGVDHTHYGIKSFNTYRLNSMLSAIQYNTVEGVVIDLDHSLEMRRKAGKNNYRLSLNTRYGFNNQHLNASLSLMIQPRQFHFRNRYLLISGGKRVSQFNHDEPIDPFTNSLYSLFAKQNFMKLYENWFGNMEYNNRFENGLRWKIGGVWEDRSPLENSTDFTFYKKSERDFLPNHPYELSAVPFLREQAFVVSTQISFQPGQHYIQFPNEKYSIGSRYPTLELSYSKGIKTWLPSDVDFDKWKFSVYDDANLKMGGVFKYSMSAGGFLNRNSVGLPDYQHFNGNQTYRSSSFLNSFQLAPYYLYSNIEKLFLEGHVEHHFNGLLTNKIPLLSKWKWYLVAGSNTFYVNSDNFYVEAFAGIENIFKIFRIDFISAYQAKPGNYFGVRLGTGGILGSLIPARAGNRN
ncbi:MAG: DUF5686 family protein, partial [Flavisolibacter sp.]